MKRILSTHIFDLKKKKKKNRKMIFLSVIINNGQSVLLRKLDIDIKFKVTVLYDSFYVYFYIMFLFVNHLFNCYRILRIHITDILFKIK